MRVKSTFIVLTLIINFFTSHCSLRNTDTNRNEINKILEPKEMNNVTSALRIFPFVYYGYISRLSLSNLDNHIVERRLEELYPFLQKRSCTALNCFMIFNPIPGSAMTVSALSWTLSFSTLSNSVLPYLLQYATGLPQALFFSLQISKYQIIISPVTLVKEGDVFAKLTSPEDGEDTIHDVLISPCDGVLQYVWPNVSTPTVAFMLIARIQCNLKIRE
ncbi:uncharacterized protein ELE39_001751 [Cryptosporidium sp. chipmunk genotype I]|uniref:uncharacterized protein n=1 Tax=Cryptosporidium sp. chipmunk genotype I TaxID=1280935 RepID=UPI00351A3708|nr:hypothetical protein ELE39_001751 [Cryptosporidium sp. chipmunk genotype I]